MDFRIIAPHTHRATSAAGAFTCLRTATPSEAGLQVTWAAYRDNELLKADCRTLNEAKKVCRSAATPSVT